MATVLAIATLAAACGSAANHPTPSPQAPADRTGAAKVVTSVPVASKPATAPSSAPAPALEPVESLPLRVKISGSKSEVSPEEAKALLLSFTVTNIGTRPIHAGLEKSVLLVNGKPHSGFTETLEEIKDDKWDSLAPGETARFHYRFAARGAVKAGEYSFVLQVGTTFSEPFVLHVAP